MNTAANRIDDYYPFGMLMVGRTFSSNQYRYGFNGMEKDDELKGSGNSYDFGARIYDPRLGRWLAVDPLSSSYPSSSPYMYVLGNPITLVDPTGMSAAKPSTHTDEQGNVIAVYNDGDNGVYKHKGNSVEAKKSLDANYSKDNTSGNGTNMGKTEYWDEFMRHDKMGNTTTAMIGAKIHFNVKADKYINGLNQKVIDKREKDGLYKTAKWVKRQSDGLGNDGNIFDIKRVMGSTDGYSYQGYFYTGRSLGNMLAGMNATSLKPWGQAPSSWLQLTLELAGKLHMKSNKLDKMPHNGRYYGEIEYAGRMIIRGSNIVKQKNGWIY